MDYGYSPIQDINSLQRIIEPIKKIKPQYGKRILKQNIKNNKEKIIRKNKN